VLSVAEFVVVAVNTLLETDNFCSWSVVELPEIEIVALALGLVATPALSFKVNFISCPFVASVPDVPVTAARDIDAMALPVVNV
jgi:hypothetical protein